MPVKRTRSQKIMSGQVENRGARDAATAQSAQHKITRQDTQPNDEDALNEYERNPNIRKEAFKSARKLWAAEQDYLLESLETVETGMKRLSEIETSFGEYKKEADVLNATFDTFITGFKQDLNHLPVSKHVEAAVNKESEARNIALNLVSKKVPETVNTTITNRLEQFQKTVLDTFVANKLQPTTERVGTVEQSLEALSNLNLRLEDYSRADELKKGVVAQFRKDLAAASEKSSSEFNTRLDTKMELCSSNLRDLIIPEALSPLKQLIDNDGRRVTSLHETIQSVCKAQKEDEKNMKTRHTKLEESLCQMQDSHKERQDQLERCIREMKTSNEERQNHLEEELVNLKKEVIDKTQIIAELKTAVTQTQVSRLEDVETFKNAISELRRELQAEREARREVEAKQQSLDRDWKATEVARSTSDEKVKRIAAQTNAVSVNQGSISRRFEAQLQNTTEATKKAVKDLYAKIDQQKHDMLQQFGHTSNTDTVNDLCNRVEKLEEANPQSIPTDLSAEVRTLGARLGTVTTTLKDFEITTENVGKLVNRLSVEIDELKDQQRKHLADCKDMLDRVPVGPFQDRDLLRSRQFDTHTATFNPMSLPPQTPSRRNTDATALETRIQNIARRLQKIDCASELQSP